MPVTYTIDARSKLIRTSCSGAVSLAEVVEHFQTLAADPDCSGGLDVLLDLSGMGTLPESRQLGAVRSAVGSIRNRVQFGACAIVATRDALFGMMRMFEVVAGDHFRAVRVFRRRNEAEAWLVSAQLDVADDN